MLKKRKRKKLLRNFQNGKITINEMRKEYGLEPIDDEKMDLKYILSSSII